MSQHTHYLEKWLPSGPSSPPKPTRKLRKHKTAARQIPPAHTLQTSKDEQKPTPHDNKDAVEQVAFPMIGVNPATLSDKTGKEAIVRRKKKEDVWREMRKSSVKQTFRNLEHLI